MICSVVLPTRRRVPLLKKCIASIIASADDKASFEIILRVHSDDKETVDALWDLLAIPQVRVAIGHPMNGYQDLCWFYEEAIALAKGDWIWVMNDDCTVIGQGWDTQLAKMPTHGTIVMPERHNSGVAKYVKDKHTPFMFIPNGAWREYWAIEGENHFRNQFDAYLWGLFRRHGWNTEFMDIGIQHNRKTDPELESERQPFPARTPHDADGNEHHMENL